MTEPKPLPKIAPCRKHGRVGYIPWGLPRVCCPMSGKVMCYGPYRATERGIINAWNKQEEDGQ